MIFLHESDILSDNLKHVLLENLPKNTKFLAIRKLLPPGVSSLDETRNHINSKAEAYLHAALSKIGEPLLTNSLAVLRILTDNNTAISLAKARGSVFRYREKPTYPIIITESFRNALFSEEARFIFKADLRKARRFADGTARTEPAFEYTLCRNRTDLGDLLRAARAGLAISIDCETAPTAITCIGYSILQTDGNIRTFTIPISDINKEDGCFWESEDDEALAWKVIKAIHGLPAPKIMQNGIYDCAWFLRYNVPPRNFYFDTMVAQYSMYQDLPKDLSFLASIYLNQTSYWKDERESSKIDQEAYWQYCGKDTYYTLLIAQNIFRLLQATPYAWANYCKVMSLNLKVCLKMSMRGILVDEIEHSKLVKIWEKEVEEGIILLKEFAGREDFNPESSQQVAEIIYDQLHMRPTILQTKRGAKLGKRSTDAKILKIMDEEGNSEKASRFITLLKDYKEAKTNLNKYRNPKLYQGRYLSNLSVATKFGRLSANTHQFYCGGNLQNFPKNIKNIFKADPGYFFLSLDYSQSDDFFIAFISQDPEKMRMMLSGLDVHSYHVAEFFGTPYEKVLAGKKAEDPEIVHPKTGLRQIIKRLVHGKNYLMQPATLLTAIGKSAAIMAGQKLGYDMSRATYIDLLKVCVELGEKYDNEDTGLYKTLRRWQRKEILRCERQGNISICFDGFSVHHFESADNPAVQREIIASLGQGGTAGNINRAMRRINEELDDGQEIILLNNVHDSLEFLIAEHRLDAIEKIIAIMETPCEINGRSFVVPVEASLGLHLGKKMLAWKPGLKLEDIQAFDSANYPRDFY